MTKRTIKLILEKTETGFSAYSIDYPVYTTAKNIPELLSNALEATQLYFDDQNIELTQEDLSFELDFKQFFQHYKVLNTKFLAQKIGINPNLFSQYVQGQKKPSINQTKRIISGIQEIGKDLTEINLIYNK